MARWGMGLFSARILLRSVVGVALVIGLTACAPSRGGLTGVTLNDKGELAIITAWCGDPPDGVAVYRHGDKLIDQAVIRAPAALAVAPVTVSLENLPDEWSLVEGDLDFRKDQVYKVTAYSSKARVSQGGTNFTLESKEKIPSGQIMIQHHGNDDLRFGTDVFLSTTDFTEIAKHYC